jgi:hypothetical protein
LIILATMSSVVGPNPIGWKRVVVVPILVLGVVALVANGRPSAVLKGGKTGEITRRHVGRAGLSSTTAPGITRFEPARIRFILADLLDETLCRRTES